MLLESVPRDAKEQRGELSIISGTAHQGRFSVDLKKHFL